MTHIISNQIFCPLCEKPMSRREVQIHTQRATIFFCRPCDIGIYDFDPAFNKWRDADKTIPCANPTCGHDAIKWFVRYMDGFFKGVCPKCKMIIKKDGDVKFEKSGAIIIPDDMEKDEIEEPVEVKIPLAHFIKKFGKDKINALRAKFKSGSV